MVSSRRGRWWALVVLDLSLLAITIDNTIMNVALPTIAREFRATGSELQWIVDAYVLFWAGLLLTAGTLGDRIGRRRVLLIGLGMLGVGAIASSFASGANQLIATRALMGAAAAFIMPATLSMITNIFDERERPKAIATWSMVSGVGMVLARSPADGCSITSPGIRSSSPTCQSWWLGSSARSRSCPSRATSIRMRPIRSAQRSRSRV